MKVDFNIKKGKDGNYSGTGIMRGVQVAQAGGWSINDNSNPVDIRVIIKKGSGSIPTNAKITIWDALDFWPQPREGNMDVWNAITPADIISHLEQARKRFGVPKNAIILSVTRQMWDILNSAGYRTFYIPHHYQPGIALNPVRKKAEVLGYEGSEKFLGDILRLRMEQIAREFGMRFLVNPGNRYGIDGLRAMDIAVSIRSKWNCNVFSKYLKSGVKLANCMASGTPFISQDDYAALEMDAPYIFKANRGDHDFDSLRNHIKSLLDYEQRKVVSDLTKIKSRTWDLKESILPMYKDTFERLLSQ